MNWYVLFVETGKEDTVQMMIQKNFDESVVRAIVPKRKLKERKHGKTYEIYRKLFPGYVLLRTQMNTEIYYKLKRIPNCNRLLNRHNYSGYSHDRREPHLFSTVEDDEMKIILQFIGNGETIDYSTLYIENAKVKVVDGPLKGKESIIRKIDKRKKRARIAVNFLGNEKLIDVGVETLSPI
ncbi:antiterminator LoaP [Bacillus thuringiensis]|uniref:antiterminator LoaP n=1 Tax=Bacillus tropicus TaxID=2026188 RepID=UPI0035D9D5C2